MSLSSGNKSPSAAAPPSRRQRICIIGAGAAGLAALKTFKDTPQFKDGIWELIAYESREDLGGVW
jgi:cation diffusion facilitator CzcD-associated flavoprotein CzcO